GGTPMLRRLAVLAAVVLAAAVPARADDYTIDPAHAGVNFKIGHVGISNIYGRFNKFSGNFTIDEDPAKCTFAMNIQVESVDTAQAQRDGHLKSPDFFNAKQYPTITFQSTSVKAGRDGYEVTGDVALHGVTKPVTFVLSGGKTAEFPKGVQRIGFS